MWITYCLKWLLEMVLTYCVHFCLACCAFSDSYTSVSTNLAKWTRQNTFSSSEETLWKAEILVSLQTWEIVKGPDDSFIKRKLKPATAWRKWRWNCRELRKEKFYQPKRKQKFPKSCFCLLQKKKGERAWKLCWLMLFLWLTVSGILIVWMSFNNGGKTDCYLLYIRGLQCRSLALLQYNAKLSFCC